MNNSNGSVVTKTAERSCDETTRRLLRLKTDALLAYLKAIQDLNNKLRQMNIDEEIKQIFQNFDKSMAEVFLREGK